MLVLGIESSCDETAAALVEDGKRILSNVVASQVDIHGKFGGIVPELASREHIRSIVPVVDEALESASASLDDIHGLAVTQGPGLVGALLIGLNFAKSIAVSRNIPITGINHLEAHITAAFLQEPKPRFPLIALVVSGGHTNLYKVKSFLEMELVGQTRDDAAGEAFDKVAKSMGLGYPGGEVIDTMAKRGNPQKIRFTRPMLDSDSLDFSFSGIKTAVINHLSRHPLPEDKTTQETYDLAASFQEAVVDVLSIKLIRAAKRFGISNLLIAGGVAANGRLRKKVSESADKHGMKISIPHPHLCTDNAVMVAALGYHRLSAGLLETSSMDVYSRVAGPWIANHLK